MTDEHEHDWPGYDGEHQVTCRTCGVESNFEHVVRLNVPPQPTDEQQAERRIADDSSRAFVIRCLVLGERLSAASAEKEVAAIEAPLKEQIARLEALLGSTDAPAVARAWNQVRDANVHLHAQVRALEERLATVTADRDFAFGQSNRTYRRAEAAEAERAAARTALAELTTRNAELEEFARGVRSFGVRADSGRNVIIPAAIYAHAERLYETGPRIDAAAVLRSESTAS